MQNKISAYPMKFKVCIEYCNKKKQVIGSQPICQNIESYSILSGNTRFKLHSPS